MEREVQLRHLASYSVGAQRRAGPLSESRCAAEAQVRIPCTGPEARKTWEGSKGHGAGCGGCSGWWRHLARGAEAAEAVHDG
jgi:hypothetical protein